MLSLFSALRWLRLKIIENKSELAIAYLVFRDFDFGAQLRRIEGMIHRLRSDHLLQRVVLEIKLIKLLFPFPVPILGTLPSHRGPVGSSPCGWTESSSVTERRRLSLLMRFLISSSN